MKLHYIYILQNLVNLKVYVGYSINPEKRWKRELEVSNTKNDKQYNNLLSKAIRRYGWNNFSKTIIESFLNQEDALEAEKFWIMFFRANACRYGTEYGYNLDDGGGLPPNHLGKKRSEEHKKAISLAHKGKTRSEETKKKISMANKNRAGNKNTIISDEAKTKLSILNTNKIVSKETGEKISKSKKGKKFSEEHKAKLSLARKKAMEEGLIPWNKKIPFDEKLENKFYFAKNKLTDEQLNVIKNDTRAAKIIAKDYNITVGTVYKIKKQKL